MTYSEKIKEIRESLGLSIRKFGELVGYSYSYISKLEKGYSEPGKKELNPSIDILRDICHKTNYSFSSFLEETGYIKGIKHDQVDDAVNMVVFGRGVGKVKYELTEEQVKIIMNMADALAKKDDK